MRRRSGDAHREPDRERTIDDGPQERRRQETANRRPDPAGLADRQERGGRQHVAEEPVVDDVAQDEQRSDRCRSTASVQARTRRGSSTNASVGGSAAAMIISQYPMAVGSSSASCTTSRGLQRSAARHHATSAVAPKRLSGRRASAQPQQYDEQRNRRRDPREGWKHQGERSWLLRRDLVRTRPRPPPPCPIAASRDRATTAAAGGPARRRAPRRTVRSGSSVLMPL